MPAQQPIKGIAPIHREIIRRIVWLNQTQRQIAHDLGKNENRLSCVINSPLFQLELKKEVRKKDEMFMEETRERIHEKIVKTAEKAIDLHATIIDGKIVAHDVDGTEITIDLPLANRQVSATAVANLFLRLTRGAALSPEEAGEVPYEKKLKEVIFRQTEIKSGGSDEGNSADKALAELTDSEVAELAASDEEEFADEAEDEIENDYEEEERADNADT